MLRAVVETKKIECDSLKTKYVIALMLTGIFLLGLFAPVVKADTLTQDDFLQESFSKTVDFFDYVRTYAANHSLDVPPAYYHAWLYMNYINTSGLKLLYAGLDNVTFGGSAAFRIPMQSFIMHYKTNNKTRDVILESTFLMLLAFNETADSIYPESPDMNDTLWASFSMGFDLSDLGVTLPFLNSKTEQIPLTPSNNNLTWTWGMKYTNLTAYWWQTWINPEDPHYDQTLPAAITIYDELSFTYNLNINPSAGTATLTENHIIGRMRDLWHGLFHYNSTGTYGWAGLIKWSNDTIYDFIQNNQIKMSIVNFQQSILADHTTYSQTATGQNALTNETDVSNSAIGTYADDGEKISEANFGMKDTYKLFNYTADPTETQYSTYNATARTTKPIGYAKNAGLFTYHIVLMKFLPLVVVHMFPGMYAKALATLSNMSLANYFYVIAYPTYSGYRVEHDPTLTVYLTTTEAENPLSPRNIWPFLALAAVAAIILIAIAVMVLRRKPKQAAQSIQRSPPAPP